MTNPTDPTPAPDNVVPTDPIMDSVIRLTQEIERAAALMREAAVNERVLRIDQLGSIEGKVARINKLLRVTVRYK